MTPLVEPVGRKLAKARESRGLTLEEAALETRIRASQLAALEADDYAAFASNTYARGFLLIYGRFLKVDVREIAHNLEGTNPISISEYQYLNAYPENEPQREAPRRRVEAEPRSRRPSLAPLIVFILLLGAAALGVHLYLQAQRLETGTKATSTSVESVEPRAGSTPISPAPAAETTTSIIPAQPTPKPFVPAPVVESDRAFLTAKPATPAPAPGPTPGMSPVFATPPPIPTTEQLELVIEPLKKTRVSIRRDKPDATPEFDDILYPKVGSLKLKGDRFFLEIPEPNSVVLRRNGENIIYQPGRVIIQ